jgi:hypothetical protein
MSGPVEPTPPRNTPRLRYVARVRMGSRAAVAISAWSFRLLALNGHDMMVIHVMGPNR